MIKDIFEIEPIQKNSFIMFLSVLCLSFLQIFIFKRKIIEESSFVSIGVALGLSVCWVVSHLTGFYAFFYNSRVGVNVEENDEILYERVALGFGLTLLFWMSLLTYIGYELQFSFKNFIRFSVSIMLTKSIFWFIVLIIRKARHNSIKENLK